MHAPSGNKNAEAIKRYEAMLGKPKHDVKNARAQQKAEQATTALGYTPDLVEKIKAAEKQSPPHLKEHADPEGRATGQRRTIAGAEWNDAGQKDGLEIWRIQNFHVVPVPKAEYGTFYDGDSYIVLKTRKSGNSCSWDIHFWLGENTTADEAGTAAYKTVELDDKFGGLPVQHREVQGFESTEFMNCFSNPITILSGGFESGFNHVGPEQYRTRLIHIKGKRHLRCEEVPCHSSSLNSGDTFIVDAGLDIYLWQGKESNGGERLKALEVANATRDQREGRAHVHIFAEGDESPEFWKHLGGQGPVASAAQGGDDFESEKSGTKRLCRLSDASGTLTFTEVANGDNIKKNQLDSSDVFIFDTGAEVYAWVGKGASSGERAKALQYAQDYLKKYNRPPFLSIAKIFDGGENEVFNAAFH